MKVSVNKPNMRVLVEGQQEGAQPLLCARECSRVPGPHAFPNAAQRVQHKKMGVDNEKIGKNFFEFLHALAESGMVSSVDSLYLANVGRGNFGDVVGINNIGEI